ACIDRFKLKLSCAARDQALVVELHYDPAIYAAAEIRRLAERFHTLMAGVTGNPEVPIAEAAIIGVDEQRLVLCELNATQAEYPRDLCIHQMFEAQVERTPDAVAIVFDQRPTTNDQRPTTASHQHATRNTQHATRNTQHATRNTQHLTYRELN